MEQLTVEERFSPDEASRESAGPPDASTDPAAPTDPTEDSQRAFLTLMYSKYRGSLLRYVHGIVSSKEEAAELVQETYLRVMKQNQLSKFESYGRNYLFATATNLARDYIRRQRHRRHDSLDESNNPAAADSKGQPECILEFDQAMNRLRSAIDSLPPLTRDVFVMSRLRDMPYGEIASALDVSVRTVERKMSEALEHVAGRLRGMV